MASNGEGGKANVPRKQPATEKAAKKVVKEKKPKTAKIASHPPYFQMIKEALLALKEKGGSSPHAIAKYMQDKHKAVLPENFRKILANQLKSSASKGKLIKVKASFKLSESGKKEKAQSASGGKRPTAAVKNSKVTAKSKKPATATATTGKPKKATKVSKKPAMKQTPAKKAKKMTPAKAKLAKSIKSPAAKKGRKTTA